MKINWKIKFVVFLGLISAMIFYCENAYAASIVGWWKFDENTGTSAADSSGNGKTGTLTNGPTWITGKDGYALDFDGSDDYVTLGTGTYNSLVNGVGAVTVSAWIDVDDINDTVNYPPVARLLINATGVGYQMRVVKTGGEQICIGGRSQTTDSYQENCQSYTVIGQGWLHVVGIANYGGDTISIYVNGQFVNTSAASFGAATYTAGTPSTDDRIGTHQVDSALFDGSIDDVRIYNDALTSDEIQQLYASYTLGSFTQSAYKWFANDNSVDVGGAAIMNQPVTAPVQGTPFRLRLLLHNGGASISQSATTSLLQFSERSGTCDTSFSGESYATISSTTGIIRYYDNASATDGGALTANRQDPRHASSSTGIGYDTVKNQVYSEGSNNFSNSQSAIGTGEDGLWDFALVDYSAPGNTTYCFRAIQAGGGVLGSYSVIPQITTYQPMKIKLRGNVKLRQVFLK